MSAWLDRPGYIVLGAALVAVLAALIVLIVLFARSGDGDGASSAAPAATQTPAGTPATAAASATALANATATARRYDNPDAALNAFIRDEFNAEYYGDCPQGNPPADAPGGVCSIELYRGAELLTVFLGMPFSETFGEAVLTQGTDGSWFVDFVRAPAPGGTIEPGADALVYGAGDCLRFRGEPALAATIATCQLDGTAARVLDGPLNADGITWWQLEGYGWASAEFLAPVRE